jgi:hypothetical protein
MPAWYYFSRPTNLAFHDLRRSKLLKTILPTNVKSLLGLGLKFCPTPRHTTNSTIVASTLTRHLRDLQLKHYFLKNPPENDDTYNPRLYIKSKWVPPDWERSKELERRFENFNHVYKKLMIIRSGRSNLLPFHRNALQTLQSSTDTIVVQCDKNLGPACIDIPTYIEYAFNDHLNDATTYRYLTLTEAQAYDDTIRRSLLQWIKKWKSALNSHELKFIRAALKNPKTDPISTFYLLMKVHKTPLKTRPIVSCSGTLLYSLGIWVDDKLQKFAKRQQSYFKSSFDLKQELTTLELPANSTIFTADAVSMYTNINTETALQAITNYLHNNEGLVAELLLNVPAKALTEALRLIMTHNVFRFGNTHWLQISGTAMGTPPAPPYATLFYAIHEDNIIREFGDNLLLYRRFIDDVFGIWRYTPGEPDRFTEFINYMNAYGLVWEVQARSQRVDFMDLTITVSNNRLMTALYEKAMNLYLYIPPHSAHPPGVLFGLIYGNVFRIQRLCSEESERLRLTKEFYQRLLARGYKSTQIRPLFLKARQNAIQQKEPKQQDKGTVFLHIPYHPNNPSSQQVQSIWKEQMLQPRYRQHLQTLTGVNRLVIAYSRPRNLGNLLSARNLNTHDGPPVSSYRIRNQARAEESS